MRHVVIKTVEEIAEVIEGRGSGEIDRFVVVKVAAVLVE